MSTKRLRVRYCMNAFESAYSHKEGTPPVHKWKSPPAELDDELRGCAVIQNHPQIGLSNKAN